MLFQNFIAKKYKDHSKTKYTQLKHTTYIMNLYIPKYFHTQQISHNETRMGAEEGLQQLLHTAIATSS